MTRAPINETKKGETLRNLFRAVFMQNTEGVKNMETPRPSSISKWLPNLVGLDNSHNREYNLGRDAINFGNYCDYLAEELFIKFYQLTNQVMTRADFMSFAQEIIDTDHRLNVFSHRRRQLVKSLIVTNLLPNLYDFLSSIDFSQARAEREYGYLVLDNKYAIKGKPDLIVRNQDGSYSILDFKCYDGMSDRERQMAHNQMTIYASILVAGGLNVKDTTILNPLENFKETRELVDLDTFIAEQVLPALEGDRQDKVFES